MAWATEETSRPLQTIISYNNIIITAADSIIYYHYKAIIFVLLSREIIASRSTTSCLPLLSLSPQPKPANNPSLSFYCIVLSS